MDNDSHVPHTDQPLKRCPQCKQYLDDQSLQAFIGDPENAVCVGHI